MQGKKFSGDGVTPISGYRFDSLFKALMRRLAAKLGGVSETECIKLAVYALAKERGVE